MTTPATPPQPDAEITMSSTLTFKRLCDAAVTMGEMGEGTADYFHGLYLNSAEHREVRALRVALRNLIDVGEEYYDMDMGENGTAAIALAKKALQRATTNKE